MTKKTDQANFVWIKYKKILDEIRYYLRGEPFHEKIFLDRLKLIDDFVTDHCMEIRALIREKYSKIFAPRKKMIPFAQAFCHFLIELLTPPNLKQIRYITRECVGELTAPTRDEDGYPLSGFDVAP